MPPQLTNLPCEIVRPPCPPRGQNNVPFGWNSHPNRLMFSLHFLDTADKLEMEKAIRRALDPAYEGPEGTYVANIDKDIKYEGYLEKLTDKKVWQKRWFVAMIKNESGAQVVA